MPAVYQNLLESYATDPAESIDDAPPPTYEESLGPRVNVALHNDLTTELPMDITMEGVLNDYWVYNPNRDLLFRAHTLFVTKGTKVMHVRSNKQAFVMKTGKRKGTPFYFAEWLDFEDSTKYKLFEIDSHENFIKGERGHMWFRNAYTQQMELLTIYRDRPGQKWEVRYKEWIISTIDFPASIGRWKIHLLLRGIDPSILVAITLVIIIGARKLGG